MAGNRQPICFIHVGPHKTGSSSIQHFVRTNEGALKRLGLWFAKLAASQSGQGKGHIDLAKAREVRADGSLEPGATLWKEIDRVAARAETDILLSSEMFCKALRDEDVLARFLAFFERRGYRVVIIAYVRDQPGWLNSWYVQSQKRLYDLQTFDAFEAAYAKLGRVDPGRYLRKYMGDPRFELVVVSFEQAIRTGLEADFIARCGIAPDAGLESVGLRNPNAGAKTVHAAQEIMRRAGSGLRDLDGYGRVYQAFKKRSIEHGWGATPYVAIDEPRYERIRARYAASNDQFARRFFGMSWEDLAPRRSYEPSVFDPRAASPAELAEIEAVVAQTVSEFAQCRPKDGGVARRRKAS